MEHSHRTYHPPLAPSKSNPTLVGRVCRTPMARQRTRTHDAAHQLSVDPRSQTSLHVLSEALCPDLRRRQRPLHCTFSLFRLCATRNHLLSQKMRPGPSATHTKALIPEAKRMPPRRPEQPHPIGWEFRCDRWMDGRGSVTLHHQPLLVVQRQPWQ